MWTNQKTWSNVKCHKSILEAIQNAIMEQQGRCTPMEALESITFTQEGRIAAQLSCSLTMKGWKHVAVQGCQLMPSANANEWNEADVNDTA